MDKSKKYKENNAELAKENTILKLELFKSRKMYLSTERELLVVREQNSKLQENIRISHEIVSNVLNSNIAGYHEIIEKCFKSSLVEKNSKVKKKVFKVEPEDSFINNLELIEENESGMEEVKTKNKKMVLKIKADDSIAPSTSKAILNKREMEVNDETIKRSLKNITNVQKIEEYPKRKLPVKKTKTENPESLVKQEISRPLRRSAAVITYTEPSLNTKLRRPK